MILEDWFNKQSKLFYRQSPKNWEHEKTGHSGKWSRITSNLFPGCRKAGQAWQFHSCSRCWWKSEKFCKNEVFFCRRHSTIEVRCWLIFGIFSLSVWHLMNVLRKLLSVKPIRICSQLLNFQSGPVCIVLWR